MKFQLRTYTVNRGAMEAWIQEWREHVYPLRRRHGFEVLGPWVIEEANKFVWILGYDGPDDWADADAAYYASPERAGIDPDPARHLASVEHHLMSPVLFDR